MPSVSACAQKQQCLGFRDYGNDFFCYQVLPNLVKLNIFLKIPHMENPLKLLACNSI